MSVRTMCRVSFSDGSFSDVEAAAYPRIVEAMKQRAQRKVPDAVVECLLADGVDACAVLVSHIIGVAMRSEAGWLASWENGRALEQLERDHTPAEWEAE